MSDATNSSLRPWHQAYDADVSPQLDPNRVTPLAQTFATTAEKYPDLPAIVFMNRRMTYRELEAEIRCFAAALARLGVEPGMKVAIQLPNLPQSVIAYYGALYLGA